MFIMDQPDNDTMLLVQNNEQQEQQNKEQGQEVPFYTKEELTKKLERLLHQPIGSAEDLEEWLYQESDLSETIQEMVAWVFINFKRDHLNEEAQRRYDYVYQQIIPLLQKYGHLFDQKVVTSPFVNQLDQERYGRLIQSRKNAVKLYAEENIPLLIKEQELIKKYNEIMGGLTIEWEGQEYTFQEMQKLLEDKNRAVREKAFRAMWDRVLEEEEQLNQIMDQLVQLRHQIALNAGFENYRDYVYQKYERFDYTPEDSSRLYHAVKKHVLPVMDQLQKEHQQVLGLAEYKPWDVAVQAETKAPLTPFQNVVQLVEGTIQVMERVDPLFADVLRELNQAGLLDLDNRSGKSPGGFCSALPMSGLSFIFMNATGTPRDVTTMIHEGGHAVHNFLMQHQPLAAYRSADKEAAELASMGMELLTMDQWSVFYPDPGALQQAQQEHLQKIISFFPWAMVVDQFQHWLYENPGHTAEERKSKFVELSREMSYYGVDTEGIDHYLAVRWMLQPHIYEVPFYYIEYVIAQLGALELWLDYQREPDATITRFKRALALGSSASLPEVYERAGLHFDLSEERLERLITHLYHALEALKGRQVTIKE